MSFFEIVHKDQKSNARAGILHTLHGELETPVLMIVGTKATVKGVTSAQLEEIGVPVVLANTYHLHLLPGEDLVHESGGLHGFMGWNKPIFTDSGGFQIFSMGYGSISEEVKGRGNRIEKKSLLRITEEGASFRSYLNGDIKTLTPESSIQIQQKLGADMIAVLDECTPFHVDQVYTRKSMEMTHRWLDRCRAEHSRLGSHQALYGIIQGGVYPDLRKISTEYISTASTDGICIGGSIGYDKIQMYEVIKMVMNIIPKEKPVHLLGIGDPEDLIEAVEQGIDSFDCVAPTRNARHGLLFSRDSKSIRINVKNASFRYDFSPIDSECSCYTCQNFSRSYLHYLLKANEMLGTTLCTIHNIAFMVNFMKEMRKSIFNDQFIDFKEKWRKRFH
jgi:queuine tRNA-ribosyltransferase